ncbi:hypothetical protein [Haloarcula sp. K1]|uniref:hypothetical protein n=1 Tax=Haloarcula sp. K1 TaxID=1622207 RepID=UPI0012BABE83|nr:hypothetical protein [Haloarcula sp. K1]
MSPGLVRRNRPEDDHHDDPQDGDDQERHGVPDRLGDRFAQCGGHTRVVGRNRQKRTPRRSEPCRRFDAVGFGFDGRRHVRDGAVIDAVPRTTAHRTADRPAIGSRFYVSSPAISQI